MLRFVIILGILALRHPASARWRTGADQPALLPRDRLLHRRAHPRVLGAERWPAGLRPADHAAAGGARSRARPFQVQWFERNRLELHPENARPYDVLLGRLGADRLAQQGRDWFTFPKSERASRLPLLPRDRPQCLRRYPGGLARQRPGVRWAQRQERGREPGAVRPAAERCADRDHRGQAVHRPVVRARALRAAPREPAALQRAARVAWERTAFAPT